MKKSTLIIISCGTLALVVVLMALPNFLGSEAIKGRIQARTSEALGMPTRIEGRLNIGWWLGLHLTANDVHIGEQNQELLVAKQVEIDIALLPLLAGNIQILSIDFEQPNIAITPEKLAKLSTELLQSMEDSLDVQEIAKLSFSGATLKFTDNQEENMSARDCNLQMQNLELISGSNTTFLQNLSFLADLSCDDFQYNHFSGSDLKIEADAAGGVVNLSPVTMQFLGGQGAGSIQADFSDSISKYQVHYVLPQLQLQGLLSTLPPAFTAAGSLDLTLNLLLQGSDTAELMRSANGAIFLHGSQLKLDGIDLDEKFEQFELSQNFNMIDAGAFFFAGPLGLLATKGYDFTTLIARSGGNSEISSLISDWKIVDGVAQSVDVAMATQQYRVALQGQLDLINAQFVDVTLAMVDREGCSLVQQEVHGSFAQPQIEQPQILSTLAGPILKLFQQGAALFTGEPCEPFYNGRVTVPD